MKRLIKPYSLLLYLLAIITFFFLGMFYAGITDAAKGQGLAGGAIVFGYGIISAFFALLISFFLAYKASRKVILTINKVLGLIIVVFLLYFTWKFYTKTNQQQEIELHEVPTQPKQPKQSSATNEPVAMLLKATEEHQENTIIGLGMFSPNMHKNKAMYFYGNLNLEKPLMEHTPTDSITFKRNKYGSIDIATAPPWLVPDHLKLDYDLLYFKVVSVTEDFLEVIVNTTNQQTAFIEKRSGTLKYWPEFLLGVNSVEFIDVSSQKVYIKPLNNAGTVNTNYSFMRPLKIQHNWMYVLLLDDGFQVTGKGWIKWQDRNQLLITYNLLS